MDITINEFKSRVRTIVLDSADKKYISVKDIDMLIAAGLLNPFILVNDDQRYKLMPIYTLHVYDTIGCYMVSDTSIYPSVKLYDFMIKETIIPPNIFINLLKIECDIIYHYSTYPTLKQYMRDLFSSIINNINRIIEIEFSDIYYLIAYPVIFNIIFELSETNELLDHLFFYLYKYEKEAIHLLTRIMIKSTYKIYKRRLYDYIKRNKED